MNDTCTALPIARLSGSRYSRLNVAFSVTDHLRAQRVDARIARHVVLVVVGREPAEDQRHGDHVLQAMIAVRGVRERPRLVDDAHAGLLRLDA